MLLDKDSVVQILQSALEQVQALPDASPIVDPLPLQAELDAANAKVAVDEAKIEKAKEDLSV